MNEEETLEQLAFLSIKKLINEPDFVEKWESKVAKKIEKPIKSDKNGSIKQRLKTNENRSPEIEELYLALTDLHTIISYSAKKYKFDINLIESENEGMRDASSLFEAGLKIKRLEMTNSDDAEAIAKQIGCACRRLSVSFKTMTNKLSIDPNKQIERRCSVITSMCELCYKLINQLNRFIHINSYTKSENNKLKDLSTELTDVTDEYNVVVAEKIESVLAAWRRTIQNKEKHLLIKNEEQRRKWNSRAGKTSGLQKYISCNANTKTQQHGQKFASNVQDAFRYRNTGNGYEKTHSPGSISKELMAGQKGFLLPETLARARSRIQATTYSKMKRSNTVDFRSLEKNEEQETSTDDSIMRAAAIISKEVLNDLRSKVEIGQNNQRLIIGFGK